MSGECRSVGSLLGPHIDGQLDPIKTLEVEDHLAACETCRERHALDKALRGSLKKAVKVAMPADVQARLLAAMAGEKARESQRECALDPMAMSTPMPGSVSPSRRAPMLRHWRTMLPLAGAAALAMAWGAAAKQPLLYGMPEAMVPAGLSDDMLRDFVDQHRDPLEPEQADPKQVRQFERYVHVPVHVPQFGNAQFVGARRMPLHGGERAVMLQYEVKQGPDVQRMTVFVYDPRKIQIGGANLAPRAIGTAEVRVGRTNGYSVAVTQHGGVGYAMASDLDPDSSATLVSAVEHIQ